MVPIPVGRSYRATASGWVWRPVRCEHCGCEFAYQITLTAQGGGFSPLFLSNYEAGEAARERASQGLQRKMDRADKATAAVACPECGKYQTSMIARIKRDSQQRGLGIFLALAIIIIALAGPSNLNCTVPLVAALALGLLVTVRESEFAGAALIGLIGLFIAGAIAERVFGKPAQLPVSILIGLAAAAFFLWRGYGRDLNANPEKNKNPAKPKHKIMRRKDFEQMAAQVKQATGKDIAIPQWPK